MKVICLLLSVLALQSNAVPLNSFLNYGSTARDMLLARSQDLTMESSVMLQLGWQYTFYQTQYNSLYVSSNGVLSFGETLDSTLSSFPNDKQLVAPFWTQNDYSSQGEVFYRESVLTEDLSAAGALVGTAFRTTVSLSSVVIVTWQNMKGIGSFNETNTFQCVIARSGSQTYIIFNYLTEGMQWAGSPLALVGVSNGISVYPIPTSNTESVLGIAATGNSGVNGRWVLRVDSTANLPGLILGFHQRNYEVAEEVGSVQVCVELIHGTPALPLTITMQAQPDTADRIDYQLASYEVIVDFSTVGLECARVGVVNDKAVENEEQFRLRLLDASTTRDYAALVQREAVVTIQDNDFGVVALSSAVISVAESTGHVDVCGVLVDNAGGAVVNQKNFIVGLSTEQGSALDDLDFEPIVNKELAFSKGLRLACTTITIRDDRVFENEESFYFHLTENTPEERIRVDTTTRGTVTIEENDAQFVQLSFDEDSYTVTEGGSVTACVEVSRGEVGGSFPVNVVTRYPSELIQGLVLPARLEDDDYIANQLLFDMTPENFHQQHCFTIETLEDAVYEGNEILGLQVSSRLSVGGIERDTGISIPRSRVAVTILDNNEVRVGLTTDVLEFREGMPGDKGSICANRSGEIQRELAIRISHVEGTAIFGIGEPGDFHWNGASASMIKFMPDVYESCTSIKILDDFRLESRVETLSVVLSHMDPSVVITVPTATVLLTDNDVVAMTFFFPVNHGTLVVDESRNVPDVWIQRIGLLDIPVNVTLVPIGRTATEFEDFEAGGRIVIFGASDSSSQVSRTEVPLRIFDDPVVEGTEEVWLTLESDEPDRVKVTDPSGNPQIVIITITEDDKVSTNFTSSSLVVSESDGRAVVCLSLIGFTNRPFTVYVNPIEDSAIAGVDFTARSIAVEFPPTSADLISVLYGLLPNERVKSRLPKTEFCTNITIIDDNVLEDSTKQFELQLFVNDTGIEPESPETLTVTIDDDDIVTVSLETSTMTVSEDVGSVRVCVQLSGSADFSFSAFLQIMPGSAFAGTDFIGQPISLTFPAHTTEPRCADIAIVDDMVLEHSEEFTVQLTVISSNSKVRPGENTTLSITIADNDFVEVVIQERDYSIVESSGAVRVCAEVIGRTDIPVIAFLSTIPSQVGTVATAGVDYSEVLNVSLFSEGIVTDATRVQCVDITLFDDAALENTESFQVVLSSHDSVVHTTPQSMTSVYIIDNDGVRIGIQEREFEAEEGQGMLEICMELIGRIERNILVELTTHDVTATGSSDYTSLISRQLSFQASDLDNQTVCTELIIVDDNMYEETELFRVALSVADDAPTVSIHIPEARVSIADDDSVSVRFLPVSYTVLEGEGEVAVCLELTGNAEIEVQCFLSTSDNGEALDYIPVRDNSVVFPPSTNSPQCATIEIVTDSILEQVEQFSVVAYSNMPRVILSANTSTVEILDDDSVTVGFVNLAYSVNEDEETERNVTVCVTLSGEAEKNVNVTIATSSNNPTPAIPGDDYIPLSMDLLFMPTDENKTQCVKVMVLDDRFKESVEVFTVGLSSATDNVQIPEQTATISILDKDVVCEKDSTDTSRGLFVWPEAFPIDTVRMPCINGTTTRKCDENGMWEKPNVESCFASVDAIFKHVFKILPDNNTGLSPDALRELIAALLRLKDEEPEGLSRFIRPIYNMFEVYALNVSTDTVPVVPLVYELSVQVLDILQFPEWPPSVLESESTRMIRAMEIITEGLLKVIPADKMNFDSSYLSFLVEKGKVDELVVRDKLVVFERGIENGVVSKLSATHQTQDPDLFLSSISLPTSIARQLTSPELGLYFSFYESSVMFPIAPGNDSLPGSHVVTPVIMATVARTSIQELKETVNYTIANKLNYTDAICVSWDYSQAEGKGNWSTAGCKLVTSNKDNITCSCTHLTNFAVLVDVRPLPPVPVIPLEPILSTLLIAGVGISLLGLTLTVVTLLLFSKLRKRDSTVFRVQLCLSMALMLLAFVCGIERVRIFELCVSISALIHYFTLVSMLWMAAEALLMVLKLLVNNKVSVAYFVVASIICWLLPIPAVVIPIAVQPHFSIHANYCFISHSIVFYAAFLGPIAGVIIFNLILFLIGFMIILRYSAKDLNNTEIGGRRRPAVRTIFVLLAVMFLFGITWVFGAFTVLRGPEFVTFLFVIFNSLQGLFIFLIFVVFAKETRELWLQTCGCRKRKFKDDFEEFDRLSRRVSRHSSLRKSGDELDDEYDYDFDGADRLEALNGLDREARMNMNSWDVMYIMPQNTFDIFLNSDQHKGAAAPMTEKPLASPHTPSMPSPITDTHIREDQSTADSGIMMDQSKSDRSPKRLLVGEPITIAGEPLKRSSSYHVHSVSGIGYVSADSDDEFLERPSPPILDSPPPIKRGSVKRASSQVYGEIYKRELVNKYSTPNSVELRRSNPNLPISRRANVRRSSSQVYGEIYKRELHSRMSTHSNSNLNVNEL